MVQEVFGRGRGLSNIGKQDVVSRKDCLPQGVLLGSEEPGVAVVVESVEAVREGRERLRHGEFVLGAIVVIVLCVIE